MGFCGGGLLGNLAIFIEELVYIVVGEGEIQIRHVDSGLAGRKPPTALGQLHRKILKNSNFWLDSEIFNDEKYLDKSRHC